ncbi:MAG: hypothetical protein EOM84_02110 [Sphingobacteriia bacterium]|nr:hypothetical protein [Sphingobacteriia bacterium]
MDQKITIFAAIKSFYETDQDMISVFSNVVLQVIESNKKKLLIDIQTAVSDLFEIDIPSNVLRTILKRLKKKEYICFENIDTATISLTKIGEEKRAEIFSSLKDMDREKKALLDSMGNFIQNSQCKSSISEAILENELNNFIEKNFYNASLVLHGEQKTKCSFDSELHSYIADFFVKSEKSDPKNFERLKAILYGKIISFALLKNNFETSAKFKGSKIYLDTNIVFSLLGYHEDFYNKSASEVAKIIRKLGLNLAVFSFTKDEIVHKLRGYLKDYGKYYSVIVVDSIYHVLKKKNISKSDVVGIIENIEKKLGELDIEVDYSLKETDLLSGKEDDVEKLKKFKQKNPCSINHDVAAILAVKKLRGGNNVHIIESEKVVFLTADAPLSRCSFNEYGHKINQTIPEVIFIDEFASILWLKNLEGADSAYIHNFLSSYTRKKLISSQLWEKFILEMEKLKEKGSITDSDIEIVMSYGETENILKDRGSNGFDDILNEDNIERIKKEMERMSSELVESSESMIEQGEKLREVLLENSEKETIIGNKNKELEEIKESLQKTRELIENKCINKWKQVINCSLWFVLGIYTGFVVLFNIYMGFSYYNIILMVPVLAILEFRFEKTLLTKKMREHIPEWVDFVKMRKNFEKKIVEQCVNKKKGGLGL